MLQLSDAPNSGDEVLSPAKSGMPVIIREFAPLSGQPVCLGGASLLFADADLERVKALGEDKKGPIMGRQTELDPLLGETRTWKVGRWRFIKRDDQG
jgi:hypothetical protein